MIEQGTMPALRRSEWSEIQANGAASIVERIAQLQAEAVGGEWSAEALQCLSGEQITLWAYATLRNELMEGGFVQLICNGYADLFFRNPFAYAMRLWGVDELGRLINKAARIYKRHGAALRQESAVASDSEDEFMALYEKFPQYDALDDLFVAHEETYTEMIAHYIQENEAHFLRLVE